MPLQPLQGSDFLSCSICIKPYLKDNPPITLSCGHTLCQTCIWQLGQLNKCPHDQTPLSCNPRDLPINAALLVLQDIPMSVTLTESAKSIIGQENMDDFEMLLRCFEELVLLLKPLAESILGTGSGNGNVLSRPMQRKLVTLIQCQLLEEDGRLRCLRASRSLGERTVIELIIQHQNPQQLASSLWAAVRSRGCQFLGPAMQEEVLRLILLALEDGSALSRKILVLFVVQRLENRFAQTSKTAVGHVVQLLYRASCFKVTKREDESSLMQLKDEFRVYESLRREHDAQIVQIAQESGIRIAPEHWAQLLYGEQTRKSHMQSIIDKLQSPQSFAQSINELLLALQRSGDPANLTRFRLDFELLGGIDGSSDQMPDWSRISSVVSSVKVCVFGLIDFIHHHVVRKPEVPGGAHAIGKYKTSLCRDMIHRGTCPRGKACTFAHTDQEMERYRVRARRHSQRCSDLSNSGKGIFPGIMTDETVPCSRTASGLSTTATSTFQPPAGAAAAGPSSVYSLRTPVHNNGQLTHQNLANPVYNSPEYLLNELRIRKEIVLAELELNRSKPLCHQLSQAFPPSSVTDSLLSSRAMNSLNIASASPTQQARNQAQHLPPVPLPNLQPVNNGRYLHQPLTSSQQVTPPGAYNYVDFYPGSMNMGMSDSNRRSSQWSTDSTNWSHLSLGNTRSIESSSSEVDPCCPSMEGLYGTSQYHRNGVNRNGLGGAFPNQMYPCYNSVSTDSEEHSAHSSRHGNHVGGGGFAGSHQLSNSTSWIDQGTEDREAWSQHQQHTHLPLVLPSGEESSSPVLTGSVSLGALSTSYPDRLASIGTDCGVEGVAVGPGAGTSLSTSLGALTEQCAFQGHSVGQDEPTKGTSVEETTQFKWSGQQDEEVPFSAGPFVSKYGPISRKSKGDITSGMNAIACLLNSPVSTNTSTLQFRPITTVAGCYDNISDGQLSQSVNLDDRHRIERRINTLWENGHTTPSSAAQQQVNLTAELVQINEQISVVEKDMRLQEELDALESLERRLDTEKTQSTDNAEFDSSSSD